jgi:predicted methyltransferase
MNMRKHFDLSLALLIGVVAAHAADSAQNDLNREFRNPDLDATRWVERFEREGREIFDQREQIVKAAGIEPGMTVADVGAGSGLFEPLFAREVGPEGSVIAVDIAPKFLKLIAARMKEQGLANVSTVLCTERSVELPPASVDLVFICDTYHHFAHPEDSMKSIHQALKPGGVLMLVEFKRIPGVSSPWTMSHVRAGQEVFSKEIEAAGFTEFETHEFLQQNYIVKFRKVAKP